MDGSGTSRKTNPVSGSSVTLGHELALGDDQSLEIVLVSYRSRAHIEELLRLWGPAQRVAVIDNSGDCDGLSEMVLAQPNCRYLDGGGQGFARAANLGAATSTAAFIAFVNPDSRPTVADLRKLTAGLAADPDAISHAASVTGADGSIEIGVGGWEPTLRRALVHSVGLHKVWPQRGLYARPALGEQCEPDWTTGACMVVRAVSFRRLGGFDELFYVYCEDESFGRRARQAGYRQVLRPDVLVAHGAGSSGAPSREMYRLRGASMSIYMGAYHPWRRAAGVLGATAFGYMLRALAAQRADPELAKCYGAFIMGLTTGRAYVGGQEVAYTRYREVTGFQRAR